MAFTCTLAPDRTWAPSSPVLHQALTALRAIEPPMAWRPQRELALDRGPDLATAGVPELNGCPADDDEQINNPGQRSGIATQFTAFVDERLPEQQRESLTCGIASSVCCFVQYSVVRSSLPPKLGSVRAIGNQWQPAWPCTPTCHVPAGSVSCGGMGVAVLYFQHTA